MHKRALFHNSQSPQDAQTISDPSSHPRGCASVVRYPTYAALLACHARSSFSKGAVPTFAYYALVVVVCHARSTSLRAAVPVLAHYALVVVCHAHSTSSRAAVPVLAHYTLVVSRHHLVPACHISAPVYHVPVHAQYNSELAQHCRYVHGSDLHRSSSSQVTRSPSYESSKWHCVYLDESLEYDPGVGLLGGTACCADAAERVAYIFAKSSRSVEYTRIAYTELGSAAAPQIGLAQDVG